ncbi:MAG: purine-nucleoside phosphorylase [Verrucomicrobia bacterium]|nr:MAG: purine-nucleoside phosphorylase [Verrucomicrobiota bacterium]
MSLKPARRGSSQAPAAVKEAARRLRRLGAVRPRLAVVLGSGFQPFAERVEVVGDAACSRLPGFARSTVPGHAARVLLARLDETPLWVFAGRCHFYEGHSLEQVTFPIRVAAALGVQTVLLTNAAGGINPRLQPGDFMILRDHINFMGVNPLRGVGGGAERFVDLSEAYDPALRRLLKKAGRQVGLTLREGIYLAVSGPSYETPAEIRAFARWGADAVGMSTVPEVIVARQCGLRVAALSCITNLAAGRAPRTTISHEEVLDTGRRRADQAGALLAAFIRLWAAEQDRAAGK